MKTTRIAIGLLLISFTAAAEWSESQDVRMRRDKVMSYRAILVGDSVIVEARHEAGWHTYAMDNVRRAREASGKEKPECELPTVIEVSGALTLDGPWYQSEPTDLSNTDIKWYTFGFEGTSYFAAKVKRENEGDATIRIDAQACNASKCSMVDGLEIVLPVTAQEADAQPPIALESLIEVPNELPEE